MSSFKDYFSTDGDIFSIETKKEPSIILEDVAEDIRKAGIKIRTILPTRFGKEIVLFNTSDAERAGKIAKTKKIDGNSIFVEA